MKTLRFDERAENLPLMSQDEDDNILIEKPNLPSLKKQGGHICVSSMYPCSSPATSYYYPR